MKTITNPRREERKEIIKQIAANDNPVFAEKGKTRVLNSAIEDLEDSIINSSRSTNRLSLVLAVTTIVLAVVGIISLYYTITSQSVSNRPQVSEQLKK